jgi:tRNA (guanine-N7-)-methyltransferase
METPSAPSFGCTSMPRRSAAYLAVMEQRRATLRDQLAPVFRTRSDFAWELGCGHGHFLTAYALANPDKLCVGIDIVGERIERALRKRDRARLENLFFVHAEARLFLETLPSAVVFTDLFILFPDPWPKLRHRKHRILQSDFLSAIAQRSTDSSHLCFRTDFRPYFDDAHALVETHPDWKLTSVPWPFEFKTVFQSRAPDYHSFVATPRRVSAS